MTPIDLTQCPPPEGMEWRPDGAVGFMCCSKTLDGRVIVINPAYPTFGVHWSVTAEAGGEVFASRAVTLADLPAAYRRALQAVGLASPWTSEVPTEGDLYLVRYPSGWIQLTSHIMSGAWLPASGRIKGLNKFPPGTLFMPCPQPPKETPHG